MRCHDVRRYGLAEGAIVKVGCLSDGADDAALLGGEEQPGSIAKSGAAAQQVAAELAAAVAAGAKAAPEETPSEPAAADAQPEVPSSLLL